ncbi:leucine-rich repeat extensin-like protein 3 [Iris pallida]|nr:leucine-rich repeat extensin-like protein 3 [Iris pallida]
MVRRMWLPRWRPRRWRVWLNFSGSGACHAVAAVGVGYDRGCDDSGGDVVGDGDCEHQEGGGREVVERQAGGDDDGGGEGWA